MIDSLIDMASELLEKAKDAITEASESVDSSDADVDVSDPESDSESDVDDTVGDALTEGLQSCSAEVSTGNTDVDDLLNGGIENESEYVERQNENLEEKKTKYRNLIPFTGATKCTLCSCGHYQGADSMDALCVCGHAKWKHVWA